LLEPIEEDLKKRVVCICFPLQRLQFDLCTGQVCGIFLQCLEAGGQLGFPRLSRFHLVSHRFNNPSNLGVDVAAQIPELILGVYDGWVARSKTRQGLGQFALQPRFLLS
jgi:hypothetical protein